MRNMRGGIIAPRIPKLAVPSNQVLHRGKRRAMGRNTRKLVRKQVACRKRRDFDPELGGLTEDRRDIGGCRTDGRLTPLGRGPSACGPDWTRRPIRTYQRTKNIKTSTRSKNKRTRTCRRRRRNARHILHLAEGAGIVKRRWGPSRRSASPLLDAAALAALPLILGRTGLHRDSVNGTLLAGARSHGGWPHRRRIRNLSGRRNLLRGTYRRLAICGTGGGSTTARSRFHGRPRKTGTSGDLRRRIPGRRRWCSRMQGRRARDGWQNQRRQPGRLRRRGRRGPSRPSGCGRRRGRTRNGGRRTSRGTGRPHPRILLAEGLPRAKSPDRVQDASAQEARSVLKPVRGAEGDQIAVQGSIKWRRLGRRRRIDPGHSSKRGESILQNKESAYDRNQNHGHALWSQDEPPAMQPHRPCLRLAPATHGYPAGGPGPPHMRAAARDQPEQRQWEGTIGTCCDDRMKQWGDGRLTNGTRSHFDPHIHEARTPLPGGKTGSTPKKFQNGPGPDHIPEIASGAKRRTSEAQ